MTNQLPIELSFINEFRIIHNSLDNALWRKNEFDADIWECAFGTERKTIDFRKSIDDGSLLTDEKNRALLNKIKRFLCLQTHPAITGSVTSSWKTQLAKIAIALHIIDYFLLDGERYQISKHGFDLVTSDDVLMFIEAISSHKAIKFSIYEPVTRIATFLSGVRVSDSDIEETRQSHPELFEIDEDGSDYLIPVECIAKARTWLKLNELYNYTAKNDSNFKYRVNRQRLLILIIGDKVLSPLKFDGMILEGLDVSPRERFNRELPVMV